MKALGEIRISTEKGFTPILGVIQAEREDGKATQDYVATLQPDGTWLYVIPFSEDNVKIASSYWKVRGWKVESVFFPFSDPFATEDFARWKKQDDKERKEDGKLLSDVRARLAELRLELENADKEFAVALAEQQAKEFQAQDRGQKPPSDEGLRDRMAVVDKIRQTIDSLSAESEKILRRTF